MLFIILIHRETSSLLVISRKLSVNFQILLLTVAETRATAAVPHR